MVSAVLVHPPMFLPWTVLYCTRIVFPFRLKPLPKVSSGVVLEADVRVPQGTVGVTRGGELKGRVVAKEFLLEDGETDVLDILLV